MPAAAAKKKSGKSPRRKSSRRGSSRKGASRSVHTLSLAEVFPPGTKVEVYDATGHDVWPGEGVVGKVLAKGTAKKDGELSFSGLTEGQVCFARAEVEDGNGDKHERIVRFTAKPQKKTKKK